MDAAEVHRLGVELYNAGRAEEGLAYVDENVIDHHRAGNRNGRDAWVEIRKDVAQNVAKMSVQVEQNVAAGEFSVNRYRVRGKRPDGRQFDVLGIDMIRVRDGRLIEHWALMDHID